MKGIVLQDWKATYVQETDTWDPSEFGHQTITLKAEDATGEGDYFLAFDTERWAVDVEEIDAWAEHMKNFLKGKLYADGEFMPKLPTKED